MSLQFKIRDFVKLLPIIAVWFLLERNSPGILVRAGLTCSIVLVWMWSCSKICRVVYSRRYLRSGVTPVAIDCERAGNQGWFIGGIFMFVLTFFI